MPFEGIRLSTGIVAVARESWSRMSAGRSALDLRRIDLDTGIVV
jgi:hypothetical protein